MDTAEGSPRIQEGHGGLDQSLYGNQPSAVTAWYLSCPVLLATMLNSVITLVLLGG